MRVLFVGDITGPSAVDLVLSRVATARQQRGVDLVVANADNTAITGPSPMGGSGTLLRHVNELIAGGVDVVTMGCHAMDGVEAGIVHLHPKVLRALNGPAAWPGRGWVSVATAAGPATIVCVAATALIDSTATALEAIATVPWKGVRIVHAIGDPHAVRLLAYSLDGEVAAVFGTLGHEPTLRLFTLPKGTLLVPDVGMAGPIGGIGGFDPQSFIGPPSATAIAYSHVDTDLVFDAVLASLAERACRSARRIGPVRSAKPIRSRQSDASLKLGLIADPHIASSGEARFHNKFEFGRCREQLKSAIDYCIADNVDAIALLGDLADRGDVQSQEQALAAAAEAERPVWAVSGNHDVLINRGALRQALENISKGHVQICRGAGHVMNSGLRLVGVELERGADGWASKVAAEVDVESWGASPVCLFTHYPLLSACDAVTSAGFAYAGDLEDDLGLLARLRARAAPTILFTGHLHLRLCQIQGSMLQISVAALIEPPHEVSIAEISVSRDEVHLDWRGSSVASFAESTKLPVLAPDRMHWVFRDGSWSKSATEPATSRP